MKSSFPKPYDSPRDNLLAINRFLMLVVVVLIGVIVYQTHLVDRATRDVMISIPPDLTHGAIVKAGEKDPTEIYAFALTHFQSLHRWVEDGASEYKAAIDRYKHLVTPRYKAFLERDYERRVHAGELENRTRTLQLVVGCSYRAEIVKVLGAGAWEVTFNMELTETYLGETIKHRYIRYFLRVVSFHTDTEHNPWLLALDGYTRDSVALSKDEITDGT